MSERVTVEYVDGTTLEVDFPSDEEIQALNDFHNEMMSKFFPDGIPTAEC